MTTDSMVYEKVEPTRSCQSTAKLLNSIAQLRPVSALRRAARCFFSRRTKHVPVYFVAPCVYPHTSVHAMCSLCITFLRGDCCSTLPMLLRWQIAQLADGFVMARQGGTVVMVSAVSNRSEMDESGFLPLAVEYREKVSKRPVIPVAAHQ